MRDQISCRYSGGFVVKNIALFVLTLIVICLAPNVSFAADKTRQEAVAERGVDMMPFDLKATTHIFTKKSMGGIQQVVVKTPGDAAQIGLIREHLKKVAAQFSKGDFSGPTHIHGAEMPGLAELQAAQPGAIKIQFRELKTGAEIIYTTKSPKLVAALHQWFDAQLADHGNDAMAVHDHSMMHPQ
jgi:hypothetical protein